MIYFRKILDLNILFFYFISKNLSTFLGFYIQSIFLRNDRSPVQLVLKSSKYLIPVLEFLKSSSLYQFNLFVDIIVRDDSVLNDCLCVDYVFFSTLYNNSIRVTLSLNKGLIELESINSLFLASIWAEREVFDMFGLFFSGNVDLRRLLTDYGFSGHPLRKNFSLIGYYEIYYYEAQKQIKFSSVDSNQNLNKNYTY